MMGRALKCISSLLEGRALSSAALSLPVPTFGEVENSGSFSSQFAQQRDVPWGWVLS